MKELLFLAHRIPYPPNKGDKLRSYNLLKQLGRDYRVHLGAFIDDPDDWRHIDALRALCGECHFAPLTPRTAKLRSLTALVGGSALSVPYYRDRGMAHWVRTLLQYERAVAAAFDASVFVSDSEADLFKRLAPECAARVRAIHNGVDTAYFDPVQSFTPPYPLYEKPIVFTGAMDYWANVEAVNWFAREVFPVVRAADNEARFYIVGARPAAEVQALRRLPGVIVVGAVDDIRPYLAHAALAVAPLRIARGVQNKVLEAMAMAKTAVVTPQALDGIVCIPGRELVLAADAPAFAAAVVQVLTQGGDAVLERAARARVLADYSWETNLEKFSALLEDEAAVPDLAVKLARAAQ